MTNGYVYDESHKAHTHEVAPDSATVLGLSLQGYYDLVSGLHDLAGTHCERRLVLILEGGYNLTSLGLYTWAALRVLSNEAPHQIR